MEYRLGEMYCGPGGIGFGATLAKAENETTEYSISHAWATDYDKDSCETYRKNICPENPKSVVHKDIRKLKIDTLAKISDINAFAFGFPCNDFSIVGEQKGIDGVYGPLYQYGIDALNYFKPDWFLAENVGGLRNSNDGKTFQTILGKMFDAGYNPVPHLYKFEEYGVPQARHRIIIIGIRNDLEIKFRVPSPLPYEDIDNTCKTAIEVPPIHKDTPNNNLTNQSKTVVERLKHIKPGENAFTADIPEHLQLNVKGAKISQIYKRLDPTKPSYTAKCSSKRNYSTNFNKYGFATKTSSH
ncbi:MAG: DNA (cytosine-5-)-methyltransferase [Aridibacter sp.]